MLIVKEFEILERETRSLRRYKTVSKYGTLWDGMGFLGTFMLRKVTQSIGMVCKESFWYGKVRYGTFRYA